VVFFSLCFLAFGACFLTGAVVVVGVVSAGVVTVGVEVDVATGSAAWAAIAKTAAIIVINANFFIDSFYF
jgi:hypothetical protein